MKGKVENQLHTYDDLGLELKRTHTRIFERQKTQAQEERFRKRIPMSCNHFIWTLLLLVKPQIHPNLCDPFELNESFMKMI